MSGSKKLPESDGIQSGNSRSSSEKAEGGADYLQRLFSDADRYLGQSPLAQKASAFTGLRPSVIVAGLAVILLVSLGTGLGGGLMCDLAGFLYPGKHFFYALIATGAFVHF